MNILSSTRRKGNKMHWTPHKLISTYTSFLWEKLNDSFYKSSTTWFSLLEEGTFILLSDFLLLLKVFRRKVYSNRVFITNYSSFTCFHSQDTSINLVLSVYQYNGFVGLCITVCLLLQEIGTWSQKGQC